MADGELFKPGRFLTHRTLASVVADPATINATNFPPASGFSAYQCQSVWIVWHGTGGTGTDTITVVPLIWDGINSIWSTLAAITLTKDKMAELYLYGSSTVFLQITTVSSTTATALTVNVAKAHSEVVE
jgi:hypothetical protein